MDELTDFKIDGIALRSVIPADDPRSCPQSGRGHHISLIAALATAHSPAAGQLWISIHATSGPVSSTAWWCWKAQPCSGFPRGRARRFGGCGRHQPGLYACGSRTETIEGSTEVPTGYRSAAKIHFYRWARGWCM